MAHAQSHQHEVEHMGDGRLVLAIAVNVLLTGAQIVGGIVSGSLSLVADALHNLNDAAALGLALAARRVARKPADKVRTFGYRKAEVIAALPIPDGPGNGLNSPAHLAAGPDDALYLADPAHGRILCVRW